MAKTNSKTTTTSNTETKYPVLFNKKDQSQIIKLFQGNKKEKGLPINEIVEQYSEVVSNTKRQVMRVLHNNGVKTYKESSLV